MAAIEFSIAMDYFPEPPRSQYDAQTDVGMVSQYFNPHDHCRD